MSCIKFHGFLAAVLLVGAISFNSTANAALVGFWGFNEGTGTTAADTSGNGFDGTLKSNATLPTWVIGGGPSGDAGDAALQFHGGAGNNGTNNNGSRVDVGNPTLLQLTGSRTQSFWINSPPLTINRESIIGKSYPHEGTMHLYQAGNVLLYQGSVSNPNANTGATITVTMPTGSVVDNTWTHVLYTRDTVTSKQQFYVNGLPQAEQAWTTSNPNTPSNAPWLFGTGYQATFNGMMDDIGFWDERLSDEEVASLYQLDAQVDNALRAKEYTVKQLDELWAIYDGGLGSTGLVQGNPWSYTTGINPAGHLLGQSWLTGDILTGFDTFLLLDANTGAGLQFHVAGVPEPSSLTLLALFAPFGLSRLRRARRAKRQRKV